MDTSLKTLRDRKTDTAAFRVASGRIGNSLMRKIRVLLTTRHVTRESIVIVIVLRSGIALLEPALRAFPGARVGVVGLKRDERTFEPHWYYENLPRLTRRDTVVICDPMLATGGSAEAVVVRLSARGTAAKNIYFSGIIAAPEGVARLAQRIPRENIVLSAIDKGLTTAKLIMPGLGDFGDRYFGYRDGGLHGTIATI